MPNPFTPPPEGAPPQEQLNTDLGKTENGQPQVQGRRDAWLDDMQPTRRDLLMVNAGAALYAGGVEGMPWPYVLIMFGGSSLMSFGVLALCDKLDAWRDRTFARRRP